MGPVRAPAPAAGSLGPGSACSRAGVREESSAKAPTCWALAVLEADQVRRRKFNSFPSIAHAAAWSTESR